MIDVSPQVVTRRGDTVAVYGPLPPGERKQLSYTYVLAPSDSDKADALKEFLTYAIGPGQSYGPDLLFAKLPSQILAADKATIAKIGTFRTERSARCAQPSVSRHQLNRF